MSFHMNKVYLTSTVKNWLDFLFMKECASVDLYINDTSGNIYKQYCEDTPVFHWSALAGNDKHLFKQFTSLITFQLQSFCFLTLNRNLLEKNERRSIPGRQKINKPITTVD